MIVGPDPPRITRLQPRPRRDRITLGIEARRAVDPAFVQHHRLGHHPLVDRNPQPSRVVAHETERFQIVRLQPDIVLGPDDLLQISADRFEAPHAAVAPENIEFTALAVARQSHGKIWQPHQFPQREPLRCRRQRTKIRRRLQGLEGLEARRRAHRRDVISRHAAAGVVPRVDDIGEHVGHLRVIEYDRWHLSAKHATVDRDLLSEPSHNCPDRSGTVSRQPIGFREGRIDCRHAIARRPMANRAIGREERLTPRHRRREFVGRLRRAGHRSAHDQAGKTERSQQGQTHGRKATVALVRVNP